MKTIFTLLSSATMMICSAQTSIQYANWSTSGQALTMYVVTDPGSAEAPTPGMDQTWDYSSVQFSQAGTAAIAPAAGTPYAATYPEANYVYAVTVTGLPTVYNYMLVNNTSIQNIATNVPVATNVYTDYNQILKFPLTYGDSYNDMYVSTENTGSSTWLFAGYGTLITSLGTFSDQVMMVDTENDDMVIWNSNPIYPRLIANSSGVNFFMPASVGTNENGIFMDQLSVFPNPAATSITMIGVENDRSWKILDLQGRIFSSGSWTSTSDHSINIEELAAGQYLLISEGERGSTATRFVKR